jgi:hypothetical protein
MQWDVAEGNWHPSEVPNVTNVQSREHTFEVEIEEQGEGVNIRIFNLPNLTTRENLKISYVIIDEDGNQYPHIFTLHNITPEGGQKFLENKRIREVANTYLGKVRVEIQGLENGIQEIRISSGTSQKIPFHLNRIRLYRNSPLIHIEGYSKRPFYDLKIDECVVDPFDLGAAEQMDFYLGRRRGSIRMYNTADREPVILNDIKIDMIPDGHEYTIGLPAIEYNKWKAGSRGAVRFSREPYPPIGECCRAMMKEHSIEVRTHEIEGIQSWMNGGVNNCSIHWRWFNFRESEYDDEIAEQMKELLCGIEIVG